MSGNEEKIEPARSEFSILLQLWHTNWLDFEDRRKLQEWVAREAKERGYDNVFAAYNEVIINGFEV